MKTVTGKDYILGFVLGMVFLGALELLIIMCNKPISAQTPNRLEVVTGDNVPLQSGVFYDPIKKVTCYWINGLNSTVALSCVN